MSHKRILHKSLVELSFRNGQSDSLTAGRRLISRLLMGNENLFHGTLKLFLLVLGKFGLDIGFQLQLSRCAVVLLEQIEVDDP